MQKRTVSDRAMRKQVAEKLQRRNAQCGNVALPVRLTDGRVGGRSGKPTGAMADRRVWALICGHFASRRAVGGGGRGGQTDRRMAAVAHAKTKGILAAR